MVDANVQREEILPSERAFSLKMKMDALNHRGYRSDLTLSHEETKLHSAAKIGEVEGLGRAQVHRYIRLTNLIPKLLNMVDEKRLPLSIAVEISYFNKNVQHWIYEYIQENGMIKQEYFVELRKYREDEKLTQEGLIAILIGLEKPASTSKKITINEKKLSNFFPDNYSKTDMEKVIYGLLEQWKQAQQGENDDRNKNELLLW